MGEYYEIQELPQMKKELHATDLLTFEEQIRKKVAPYSRRIREAITHQFNRRFRLLSPDEVAQLDLEENAGKSGIG